MIHQHPDDYKKGELLDEGTQIETLKRRAEKAEAREQEALRLLENMRNQCNTLEQRLREVESCGEQGCINTIDLEDESTWPEDEQLVAVIESSTSFIHIARFHKGEPSRWKVLHQPIGCDVYRGDKWIGLPEDFLE